MSASGAPVPGGMTLQPTRGPSADRAAGDRQHGAWRDGHGRRNGRARTTWTNHR
jgi:hypothetical protein